LNGMYCDFAIVNPAACLCHPYRTKYDLHISRSHIRSHHAGDLHDATSVSPSSRRHILGILYCSVSLPATSHITPCSIVGLS
jgi:hypothetical protein